MSQLLGTPPVQEEDADGVAEQLARINEQLAVKNRRARRIWRTVAGVLIALAAVWLILIILNIGVFPYEYEYESYTETSSYVDASMYIEPVPLQVICGAVALTTELESFSWPWWPATGGSSLMERNAVHPLLHPESVPVLYVTEEYVTVSLLFDGGIYPDSISAQCWHESDWGSAPEEAVSQTVEIGDEIMEAQAGYLYEITAVWYGEDGQCGTADYSFCLKMTE